MPVSMARRFHIYSLNWRYIRNWIGDISNSIEDIYNSFGDISKYVLFGDISNSFEDIFK